MNFNVRHWEADPLGFLIDRLFPDQRTFANQIYWEEYPEYKERFEKANAEADDFLTSIVEMPQGLLEEILEKEKQNYLEERLRFIVDLDRSRFFNSPAADANWSYWAQISFWKVEEAVALSFAKDPFVVSLQTISQFDGNSVFVGSFQAKLELVNRAIEAGQLSGKNSPPFFLAWAVRTGFDMPSAAFDAVQARGLQIGDWKTEYDKLSAFLSTLMDEHERTKTEVANSQAELDTIYDAAWSLLQENQNLEARIKELELAREPARGNTESRERKSMLTLILAMAIKKYQFDPTKAKNAATSNIASAVAQIGLRLDEDTVRKFLNEARVLLQDKTE